MTLSLHTLGLGTLLTLTGAVAQAQGSADAAPAAHQEATPQGDAPATETATTVRALQPAGPRWHWSSSTGFNHYREPSLDMRLQGFELGAHLRLTDLPGWPRLQAEADVLTGLQRYDSPSGRLDNLAENIETRWRLLYQAWPLAEQPGQGLFLGPAVHTLYNDLRGLTDQGAAGYQRTNVALWLAAQWRQPLPLHLHLEGRPSPSGLQLDAGWLIRARHRSHLSQAVAGYPDIGNTQRRGWYAQARLDVPSQAVRLQPFVRYTRLKDSDESVVGFLSGIEPASHRWQLGVSVAWPAR